MIRNWVLAFAVATGVGVGATAIAIAGDQPHASLNTANSKLSIAIFAGGCFWCMEHPFDKLDGVISTTSGYAGGHVPSPTYKQVSSGGTGHAEVVRIEYDPTKVRYETLLRVFWRNVDPLDGGGQFCDRGDVYRTGIFYVTDEQKRLAEQSKTELEQSGRFDKPIVTEIAAAGPFYAAEAYHQDYYERNPFRYKYYRYSCGRDHVLEERWGSEAGGETN